jgi:uncharacterized protein YsxB (DUF464 family)
VIRARVVLDIEGRILGFDAAGHAERAAHGNDVVCAAFTVLARTAYRALESLPGIELKGTAPEPGSLSFVVLQPAANSDRAAGIADSLITGMSDLAREYPGAVAFTIERDWEE